MHTNVRTVRTALIALRRNIMRSALTCLGIIIGVSAVIATVEIGTGATAMISRTISNMGSSMVIIFPGTSAVGGVNMGMGSVITLSPKDCEAIMRECPAVKTAAPLVFTRQAQAVNGARNYVPNQFVGTAPEYLVVRDWENLDEGDVFTDTDVRNMSKVCLLGATVKKELFGDSPAVGHEIRLANITFKVVGVLRRKGGNMMGQDQDDVVIAPWTTIKYRISNKSSNATVSSAASGGVSNAVNSLSNLYPTAAGGLYPAESSIQAADTPLPVRFANVDQILCSAQNDAQIPAAVDQVTSLLRERHRLAKADPDDFQIRDMAEIRKTLSTTTNLMGGLLLGVAAISLVVGGVGIMNIMLVSVTERTREIGLRMAVGARQKDILRQFLIESVLLCLIGGGLGIALGRGVSLLLRKFANLPTELSVTAILVSVAVSAGVGLVFGFYPAFKASRLDPIEALRYE